ncbi:MAG: phospholipase D-like domain-containing protein [Waddliaceae bacterium]
MAAIRQCQNSNCKHSEVGFGEIVKGHQDHKKLSLAQKVAQVAIVIFTSFSTIGASAVIGFAKARVLGAVVGGAIGVCLVIAGGVSFIIFRLKHEHRHHPISTSGLKFPEDTPSLGKFHEDHHVLVTKNSKETTEWKLDLIDQVEHFLEMSVSIGGGPTFRKALKKIQSLIERKPHVKVHLLTTHNLLEKEDTKLLKKLAKDYPDNFRYCITPLIPEVFPRPQQVESHPKIMVVDEKYFVVGGTNLQEELIQEGLTKPKRRKGRKRIQNQISSASRDMDVVGYGPLAKTLRREFFKLYANWEYRTARKKPKKLNNYYTPIPEGAKRASFSKLEQHPGLVHNVKIKAVVSSPENQFNNCTDEYERVIKSAKKTISLANMYFVPAPAICKALSEASDRCRVTLITNSKGKNGPPSGKFFVYGSRLNYPLIMKTEDTKSRIFEYSVPDTVYHPKRCTADGKTTVIGSYNTGPKSHSCDYEITLTLDSEEVVKKIDEVDAEDLKHAREISYREAKKLSSSFWTKVIGRVENNFLASLI